MSDLQSWYKDSALWVVLAIAFALYWSLWVSVWALPPALIMFACGIWVGVVASTHPNTQETEDE